MSEITFEFAEDGAFTKLLLLAGVTSRRSSVVVDDDTLRIRFGPWRLTTERSNVLDAEVTGPYRWWRAVGVRMSLSDRGVTFGSTPAGGTCIRLRAPVAVTAGGVALPLRHPSVTVTVADPEALAELLST